MNIYQHIFLTSGVGRHPEQLISYDLALRDAGIAPCNLVCVSSILPPKCNLVDRDRGVLWLWPGQITHCVLAEQATNEEGRQAVAAVGVAWPEDRHEHGYIAEYHGYGHDQAGEHAAALACVMLATVRGDEVPAEEDVLRSSGRLPYGGKFCEAARFGRRGEWLTVLAAAVFCEPRGP